MTEPKITADELPSDLRALLQILSGLELIDRVIDEGLYHGSDSEAVSQARSFLRGQHSGVVKNIKDHPQADLVLKKKEGDA